MLKRLLTAVLVLGLFLVLSGTAFSAPGDLPGGDGQIREKANPAPNYPAGKVLPFGGTPSQVQSASDLVQKSFTGTRPSLPGVSGADTTTCGLTNYADWANATYFFSFAQRSNLARFELATRYDGPQLPGYKVRVNGAYNWIYRVAEDPAFADGQADVVVKVYTDAAGLPGPLVYSETFTVPAFGNQWDYLYFGFSNEVLVSDAYHISFSVGGPTTDTVVFTSDDAGYPGVGTANPAGRSSMYYTPDLMWYSAADYYAGGPVDGFAPNFDVYSDWCHLYSSCALQTPLPPPGYYGFMESIPVDAWADGSTLNGFGQYYTALTPETLKYVRIYHYDFTGADYGPTSTNGLIVSIYPDDGTGNVNDAVAPLATEIVPPGIGMFPMTGWAANGWNAFNVDFSSHNLVLYGPYHVTIQTTTDDPANGKLNIALSYENPANVAAYTDATGGSVNFTAPGAPWTRMFESTVWMTDPYSWQIDFGVMLRPYTCKDEFSICQFQPLHDGTLTSGYGFGPASEGWSRAGVGQMVAGNPVNRVDEIYMLLADDALFGDPGGLNGTPDVYIRLRDGSGGTPGAVIWEQLMVITDVFPGWTHVVIPGGAQVLGNFFLTIEEAYSDPVNDYLYVCADRQTATHTAPPHYNVNGGGWQLANADGLWHPRTDYADNVNWIFEVGFCSIPLDEWACGTAGNFAMANYDYGHTSHTDVALSDAYCDLNIKWIYTDAGAGSSAANGGAITDASPIIYDNFVVTAFWSKFLIHDLTTGALLKTINGSGAPYYVDVNRVRSIPTIAEINVGGIVKPVLFFGGGTSAGNVTAVDMSDPLFPALWSINLLNRAAKGYPSNLGNTQYSSFIVSNVAGDDVVYFATIDGKLWAADAETGDRFWGPVTLNGAAYRNIAFDGTNLYTACISTTLLGIPDGDVYKVDATTGAILWTLATGPDGLQTQPGCANEIFIDHLAYYDGEVYATSSYLAPAAPYDGVFYRIDASDGSVLSASDAGHQGHSAGFTIYANLLVDEARVILTGGWTWAFGGVTPVYGGGIHTFNRYTGSASWATVGGHGGYGRYVATGFLTCEPGAPDLLFAGDTRGYLSVFDANDGNEIFHRRLNGAAYINDNWAGGAVSADGIVVFATAAGELYAFEKGVDVARIEVVNSLASGIVPYGSASSVLVTVEDVFTNTGCIPLTGFLHISDVSNGSPASARNPYNVAERTASIAKNLASGSSKLLAGMRYEEGVEMNEDYLGAPMNLAAAAMPPYLNGPSSLPFSLNAGDTADLVFDVNQSVIARGSNLFYVAFETNDPNYFVDFPAMQPQAQINLIAGCLLDSTFLSFGAGGANFQAVTNSGRLATGDWITIEIAGDHSALWQGSLVYGVSQDRIAINTQTWGGGGEEESWKSMQADPNLCDASCKPKLETAVALGMISADGVSYTGLSGDLVCKVYVDSVQNFDLDGTDPGLWNWTNFSALFDNNLTMGLKVISRTFAVTDAPLGFELLNDMTVEYMKIFQRDELALDDWYMGAIIDFDIGDDSAVYNADYSAAWSFSAGTKNAGVLHDMWGFVKIPFGGDYAPMVNAKALAANQAGWNTGDECRGSCVADSAYYWMSHNTPPQDSASADGDQEFFMTLAGYDFAAGVDTLKMAMVTFAIPTVADVFDPANVAPIALLANKWLGFGRGDVNNDGMTNIADIVYLADFVALGPSATAPGPIPFEHLGDVNIDDETGIADVTYLMDYYFFNGPAPLGQFIEY